MVPQPRAGRVPGSPAVRRHSPLREAGYGQTYSVIGYALGAIAVIGMVVWWILAPTA
ncbi:hypothetical protein AB0K60_31530 [Thermopolyspora sp. NPDC052614]|uniref:hypothetical protein n=1 Tax=Thermopolyspora sp. NPDC052614 TaxID=3155682 RepID=UPI0034252AD6